jgi:F0F1-type ATP synthase assembly protein I
MEVRMRERYIPAMIMLLAGTITSIINILNKVELVSGLKRLLLVLILFYILGLIAKGIINKALAAKKKQTDEETTEGKEEQTDHKNT